MLMEIAHPLAHERALLSQDDIARVDAEVLTGHDARTVEDFVLDVEQAPQLPVLAHVLELVDREGFATYQATLDIIPDGSAPPRACARLRIRNPEYGRRTIEMALHRCGIRMQSTALRHYLHYPLPRHVGRWEPVMPEKLVALAPVARLAHAHHPLNGGMPLKAMTGELRSFAPFEATGNANTLLIGEPGNSRHALACEMLTGHLAGGGTVCVFDHDGAFEHLAAMLNGEVVRIGTAGAQGLDLLRTVKGIDDIYDVGVVSWIVTLAGFPEESSYQYDAYCRIAHDAVQALLLREAELTLSEVRAYLLALPVPLAQELAAGLAPYVDHGGYAALFDGPPLEAGDDTLTVIDVSAWRDHPLLPHVVHAARQVLDAQACAVERRSKKKLFVLSQACGLHAYPRSLSRWLRIARRYGVGTLILARPDDIADDAAFAEHVDEFSNCVVLGLTGKAKDMLVRRLGLTDSLVWQLGAAGVLGDDMPSMRGNIRLLLYTDWMFGAFEFRPDPASRELYALPFQTAQRAREVAVAS